MLLPGMPFPGHVGIKQTSASGLSIQSTTQALNTTTGTQDITISGFGTPKAALFLLSHAITAGSLRDSAIGSFGACDGTREWVTGFVCGDNDTNNRMYRRASNAAIAQLYAPTTGDKTVEASFSSFITDGVRISIDLQDAGTAYLLTVVLFGGDDLSAYATNTALATQNNTVTITPNFETHVLFTASSLGTAFDDTSGTGATGYNHGFASYDGVTILQSCAQYRDDEQQPTLVRGEVRDGAVYTTISNRYAVLQNIDSTTFELLSQGADLSSNNIGVLALNIGDDGNAWAGVVDSPTSTGDKDFTDPGFQPIFAMMRPTMASSIDTNVDEEAGGFALSVVDSSNQDCIAYTSEDNVSVSNTTALQTSQAISFDDHTGTDAFAATFDSFLSNGMRLNFTDADGTIRKWPMLFIG